MSTILKVDKIDAFYGAAHILHGMSLQVEAGERVALIGRNGVGKTTLVNAVLGLAAVRSGELHFGGQRIRRPRPYDAANHGIGVVPQGRRIIANLTVAENLTLGSATRRPGPWHLEAVLNLFPILRERANTPGTALSGGQQQMLAIGRTLMSNPALIILDEPTEGLAPVIVDQLADILNGVAAQGTALLLIEQNLSLVARVAQRYYAAAKGAVTAAGRLDAGSLEQLKHHVAA
jgi:ABC-type branched-subunit amino acid transport system ATPase component